MLTISNGSHLRLKSWDDRMGGGKGNYSEGNGYLEEGSSLVLRIHGN